MFIILCIVFNTVLLALDKYPLDTAYVETLEALNLTMSAIFLAEMIIKMIGLGLKEYSADSFNVFDCTIVMISIFDFIIDRLEIEFGGGAAISALRAIRLLRVFKLARSWTSFRDLL